MYKVILAMLAVGPLSTAQTDAYNWLEIRTDVHAKAPGIGVLLEWGTDSNSQTTDIQGRTISTLIPTNTTVSVTLSEVRTTLGSTVGQVLTFDSEDKFVDESHQGHARVVPEARLVDFIAIPPADEDYIHHDENTQSWYAHPQPDLATYDFSLEVAPLRDTEQIDGYFYYQNSAPTLVYKQGLLLRSGEEVFLGTDSVIFAIATLGHSYSNPSVDVAHFTDFPNQGAVGVVVYYDSVEELVLVHLQGELPEGDTLILLHDQAPAPTETNPTDPVPIPPPSGGGGMLENDTFVYHSSKPTVASLVLSQEDIDPTFKDCEPAPLDDSYCEIPQPNNATATPDNDCGATLLLGHDSGTEIKKAWSGKPPCNSSGVSKSTQICWEIGGSLEFNFELGDVVEINAGGHITKLRCKTVTVANCICVGTWICEWFEYQFWKICSETVVWDLEEGLQTINTYDRKKFRASGSEAIEQETTCTPTGSGCS